MLGCRLSSQSPPLGLWKKTKPPSPVVLIDSTHWPIAANPALGDAANGAGPLLPPPANGASSVDGSARRPRVRRRREPASAKSSAGSIVAQHGYAGITPARADQIARLRFVFLRKRMFISSTSSENAIAK